VVSSILPVGRRDISPPTKYTSRCNIPLVSHCKKTVALWLKNLCTCCCDSLTHMRVTTR